MISTLFRRQPGGWLPISVLATSALILTGCAEENSQHGQMPPPAVSVFSVTDQKVGDYYEYVGRSEAINSVDIQARVEGFLVKRNFTEGGTVDQGQLLYEIDRAPFEAALKGAKAQLNSSQASLVNARKNLSRTQDLIKRGAISQSDYDNQVSAEAQAAAAVQLAQANLETAQLNLGYTRIYAPFSGDIGKSNFSVGNLIKPTSGTLATLTSMDPIYVTFQVDERQLISHLTKNPDARATSATEDKDAFALSLKLPNGQQYNQPGTFSFADTQVNETMGTLTLRATFPNPEGIILPGLYVTVQAESNAKTPLPLIPQSSVQQDQGGHFVLVIKPDNTVESRHVQLGRRINAMWAVKSGLQPGEQIIVQGLQKVRVGSQVNPTRVAVNPTTGTISALTQPQATTAQEQGH